MPEFKLSENYKIVQSYRNSLSKDRTINPAERQSKDETAKDFLKEKILNGLVLHEEKIARSLTHQYFYEWYADYKSESDLQRFCNDFPDVPQVAKAIVAHARQLEKNKSHFNPLERLTARRSKKAAQQEKKALKTAAQRMAGKEEEASIFLPEDKNAKGKAASVARRSMPERTFSQDMREVLGEA